MYSRLIPPQIFSRFQIHPDTLCNDKGEPVFTCFCPPRTSAVRIELRHQADAEDPVFLLEMTDTSFGDLEILFLNMNDPGADRFYIDRDAGGNNTEFATVCRNIPEEIRAMNAGLAPGQIRRGLRLFRSFWKQAQEFGQKFDINRVKVEPMSYHNVIMHEFYGFRYLTGRNLMEHIDREFARGGVLFKRLDGSTPFRQPGAERSIRSRSWAIHDGILDEPWQNPRMYYTIEEPLNRVQEEFTCHVSRYENKLLF